MTLEEINSLKEAKKGQDQFSHPDFYNMDDLLTEEHLRARQCAQLC